MLTEQARRRAVKAAYQRKWCKANPEKAALITKRSRAKRKPETSAKIKEYQDNWRKANPQKVRAQHRKTRYGITQEQWDALFTSQGNRCVCGASEPGSKRGWHTDHNHETGKVRGILCHHCNHTVHKHATPETLRQLADYLECNQ